jgi:Protein of unknown function (DUF3684)
LTFQSFQNELRNIAVNSRLISSATLNKMRLAPILLGLQRKPRNQPSSGRARSNSIDIDEDEWDMQYDLKKPDQIIIADDRNLYHLFGESIFTAPQEDLLEGQSMSYFNPPLIIRGVS